MRRGVRRYWAPYVFISPFYILFAIFGLFPPLFGFYLSFHRWDGLTEQVFVGLRNYELVLTDDLFWKALANNLIIAAISTVPCLSLALGCAFLLNQRIRRFRDAYLASFFSPAVASVVAVTVVFGLLYGREYGFINGALRLVGLPTVDWLQEPVAMKASLAILLVWRWLGYNTVIYLAGLQAVPAEYYEAARVDGATTWHLFRHVSVPLLRPTILFTTVTSTIGILQLFAEPYLLANSSGQSAASAGFSGGAGYSLLTMTMYLYNNAFSYLKFGYASAIAYVMFVIIFVGSLLNLLVIGRRRWGEH
ncbi:MAG TPA: sugar ABC transporter permease [Chloroflexota bacterium]|nr:sugar ABC transporter permease [Chloroflexota bacterium]